MRTLLVEASPRNPATGAVVPTRLVHGGVRAYTWLGFTDWRGGVIQFPAFTTRLDFGDAGWTGGAIPQTAAIEFSSADPALVSRLAALYWNGAAITLRVDDDERDAPSWPVFLKATVATADTTDSVLTLTIGDMSVALNKPLAPDTFAGSGGIEGSADCKGRAKRRTFGAAYNIEGRILDPLNLIYEFSDPAKPLTSIDAVRDRGRAGPVTIVNWQGSAAATLTALRNAAPPRGGGVIAPSIACVKWWTTAAGPLTADVVGETYSGLQNTAPQIANLIAGFGGLTVSNLAAANAARPALVGLHVTDSSETIASALDRLLVGSSLLWVLNPDGTIRLEYWSFDASIGGGAVEEITSHQVSRKAFYRPIKSRALGYKPNSRVMNDGDIAPVLLAEETVYPDGTPVADLQPAQAGADVTGQNTSKDSNALGGVQADIVHQRIQAVNDGLANLDDDVQDIIDNAEVLESRVDALRVSSSPNRIGNSDLSSKAGWALFANPADRFFWGISPADFKVPGEDYFGLLGLDRNSAHSGDLASDWTAISPGGWWQASSWIASRECTASIALQWGDAAGNFISEGPQSETIANNAFRGSSSLDGFKRVWCKGQPPANARTVRLKLHKGAFVANPPNDLAWLFALRPMLALTNDEPLDPAPYMPRGGGAALTQTTILAASANEAAAQLQSILQVNSATGQSARVNTIEQAAYRADDRTSGARWSKEAVAGNGRAQLTVYAFDNNGNLMTGVDIIGDLTISGNLFVTGSITTRTLAANSVNRPTYIQTSGEMTATALGGVAYLLSANVNIVDALSTVELDANVRFRGKSIVGHIELWCNGQRIEDLIVNVQPDADTISMTQSVKFRQFNPGTGNKFYELRFYNTGVNNTIIMPGTSFQMVEVQR